MNNDLISREALKRKLQYVYSCDYIDSKSKEGIASDIIDEIDNAPTVFSCNACKNMGNEQECVDCHDYSNYVHYEERPQGKWSLVEHKKNIDLVCPCCGYHRCNLAYGFSIEEVREQIKENTSNAYLLPDFCERCGTKLGFGGNKE